MDCSPPRASLSVEFSRQEYWSGLQGPSPGVLLTQGSNQCLFHFPHWQASCLLLAPSGKPMVNLGSVFKSRDIGLPTNVHMCVLVIKSCPTLCDPMDYSPPGSSVYGIFPGKNIGVGGHFLLQGIFPTQGSNSCLLHLLH